MGESRNAVLEEETGPATDSVSLLILITQEDGDVTLVIKVFGTEQDEVVSGPDVFARKTEFGTMTFGESLVGGIDLAMCAKCGGELIHVPLARLIDDAFATRSKHDETKLRRFPRDQGDLHVVRGDLAGEGDGVGVVYATGIIEDFFLFVPVSGRCGSGMEGHSVFCVEVRICAQILTKCHRCQIS